MSERFFVSEPITGDHVTLDGPEAHHLLHVMRAAAGDHVTLFDGSGAEFVAVVESVRRSNADVRIVERREVDRELSIPVVVGVSLPKGDRQKWLIEKLTELGVTAVVPLSTERGVAVPTNSALERLQRAVIEASKQCGRNRLMQTAKPQRWADWVSQNPMSGESAPPPRRLLAHPGGTPLAQIELPSQLATQLAVGPEGGLTDAEVAAALAADWQMVDLGPRILRVETASIALASTIALCCSRA
jgi:16S rRNA (uracil1498-N3)-methyltransferase